MYYILCYKGRQLGKPMKKEEAMDLLEEMKFCFQSITLKELPLEEEEKRVDQCTTSKDD